MRVPPNFTFTDFIRSGFVGSITTGTDETEVSRVLGRPEATGQIDSHTSLWDYGGLQLTLHRGAVELIGFYFRYIDVHSCDGKVAGHPISTDTTYDDFLVYIRAAHMSWQIYEPLIFGSQTCLLVGCGV